MTAQRTIRPANINRAGVLHPTHEAGRDIGTIYEEGQLRYVFTPTV